MPMKERYEAAKPQRHIEVVNYREGIRLTMRDAAFVGAGLVQYRDCELCYFIFFLPRCSTFAS